MPTFRVHHRHAADECAVVFAAWQGFASPLRHRSTVGSCRFGGHEIWWDVEAVDAPGALALLPRYVADRATAARVGDLPIP